MILLNGMQKEDFNAWYYSMECKKKTLMHDTTKWNAKRRL